MILDQQADILVVSDSNDLVAIAFEHYLKLSGIVSKRMSHKQFSGKITLKTCRTGMEVIPENPVFLRPPAVVKRRKNADEHFFTNEQSAIMWAACAMGRQKVINRPTETGWSGKLLFSAIATKEKLGIGHDESESISHLFSMDHKGTSFFQDLYNGASVQKPSEAGLLKIRSFTQVDGWEQIIVVGNHAFRATDYPVPDIEGPMIEQCVNAVKLAGLQFASVSVGINLSERSFSISRINPYPHFLECEHVMQQVCVQLTALLLENEKV